MVVEVRPNLGCALERRLDKKAGLCRLRLLVSTSNLAVYKAEHSPVVKLIRALPKTDFRDIVDHSVSQSCRPVGYLYLLSWC